MTTFESKTGMTRIQLENYYIQKVNLVMSFGFTEREARKMVQETLKQSLELK